MPPDAETRKPLQSFAVQAVFVTLLIAFVPSASRAYQIFFSGLANAVTAPFAGEHAVEFDWIRVGARTDRGEIVMRGVVGDDSVELWQTAFSISDRGYQPGALFVGLMAATPAPVVRQAVATLGGLLLQQLFLIGQLGALGLTLFQKARPEELGGWLLPLEPVIEAFLRSPLPRYVVVLALWAVLARPDRSIDWSPLTDRFAGLAR